MYYFAMSLKLTPTVMSKIESLKEKNRRLYRERKLKLRYLKEEVKKEDNKKQRPNEWEYLKRTDIYKHIFK